MALDEIRQIRIQKLEILQKAGINPYPARSNRTHSIKEVLDDFIAFEKSKEHIVLAGRILAFREHGGAVFADIYDGAAKIQIYIKKDILGHAFDLFSKTIDIGDFIEVKGALFRTKKGEMTLEIAAFMVLAKSLLPLPEKWHGIQDVEERFRKRYLDLLLNEGIKDRFILRAKIISAIREFLISSGFIEVETPVLQILPGGATARPFMTHMNDLNLDLYLRVAPELYLKRLLVGGMERIFEIGKNFRNEGMDREHNPEFTMLEAYAAYKDYNWLMDFTENLFRSVVDEVFGKMEIETEKGIINFQDSFARIEFNRILETYTGLDYDEASENNLAEKAKQLGVVIEKHMTKGVIADEIYKKVARPNIIQPTFITNHPLDISPLTKKMESNPTHVERFQPLIGGMEIGNAFSELNDPIDQRERFEEQEKIRGKGNQEAQRLDKDFVEAMEYGMPPAAGIGIGIDRFVALLTGSHTLREAILFPTMRPKE